MSEAEVLSREDKRRLRKKLNRKRKRQAEASRRDESEDEKPKPKVYTVSLPDEEKEAKKHRGLRCKKCLHLLCKDEDFSLRNEELWFSRSVLTDNHWHGVQVRKGQVFCQNMHKVGSIVTSTHANDTILVPVIKIDKTTYRENFLS